MRPPATRFNVSRVIAGFVCLVLIAIGLLVGFILYVVRGYVLSLDLASATGGEPPSFEWLSITVGSVMFVLLISGLAILFAYYLIELRNSARQTQFLAGITHELKSPLSAIQLYAQSLEIGGDMAEDQRARFLRGIVDDVRRLDRLVSNITETGKYDLGVTDMRFAEADAGELLSAWEERIRDRLSSAERTLEIDFAIEGDATVNVDGRLIEQVIDNLVDNAVKYSEAGGRVSLRARVEDEALRITCADDGMGIERSEIDSIFDRFYRTPKAQGRPGGGTGLGLFISRRIIESHDGSLDVQSEGAGKGATFVVELPLVVEGANVAST